MFDLEQPRVLRHFECFAHRVAVDLKGQRQIVASLSQIMGMELTDHVHVLAGGDDDDRAAQSSAAQGNDDE